MRRISRSSMLTLPVCIKYGFFGATPMEPGSPRQILLWPCDGELWLWLQNEPTLICSSLSVSNRSQWKGWSHKGRHSLKGDLQEQNRSFGRLFCWYRDHYLTHLRWHLLLGCTGQTVDYCWKNNCHKCDNFTKTFIIKLYIKEMARKWKPYRPKVGFTF